MHEVAHQCGVVGNVEVTPQPVQRLLNPLMADCMGQEEHLVAQITVHRHKDAGAMKEQAVLKAPRRVEVAGLQLLEEAATIIGACSGATNVIEEAE